MDTNSLRDHLKQLRTELATSESVDAESRQLLGDIMRDIDRLTDLPDSSPALRLEGLAVQFEAGHPALAATIRRLVDLLGKLGV